jgi:hypothetical protein
MSAVVEEIDLLAHDQLLATVTAVAHNGVT